MLYFANQKELELEKSKIPNQSEPLTDIKSIIKRSKEAELILMVNDSKVDTNILLKWVQTLTERDKMILDGFKFEDWMKLRLVEK